MKKKMRFTLGKKMVLMILAMSAILCAVVLFTSYRTYRQRTTSFYEQLGYNVVRMLASQLDPDELDRYYKTQEMDQRYYEIQGLIAALVDSSDVEYLYVVRPNGVGVTFLFDSDKTGITPPEAIAPWALIPSCWGNLPRTWIGSWRGSRWTPLFSMTPATAG